MSEVTVKKLPPGEVLGARDLQRWSTRRRGGRSGVGGKAEEEAWRHGVDMLERPLLLLCRHCGHRATLARKHAAELGGKTLRYTACEGSQRFPSASDVPPWE